MIEQTFIQALIDVVLFLSLYTIVTTALNYQYGYTGIPNFGLAFAVAGGAYITGFLPGRIAYLIYKSQLPDPNWDYVKDNAMIFMKVNQLLAKDPALSITLLILTLVAAMGVGALLGFVATFPAVRLRADFLMIVLIAFAEAVRIIGMNYEPLAGGTLGIGVPKLLKWTGLSKNVQDLVLVAGLAIVVVIFNWFMLHSPYGRLLRAVRESEYAATAVGKDVNRVKMEVMVVGSAIAAIAGAIHGFYLLRVIPPAYTRYDWTFWPWLMLMLGGRGSELGALAGTSSIIIIRRLVSIYKHAIQAFIPFDVVWLERMALGIAFLVIMIFKPDGLIPEKPFKIKGLHDKELSEDAEVTDT